jgi:hypothetical protein
MRGSQLCRHILGRRLVAIAIFTVAAGLISAVAPTHAVPISGAIALREIVHVDRLRTGIRPTISACAATEPARASTRLTRLFHLGSIGGRLGKE